MGFARFAFLKARIVSCSSSVLSSTSRTVRGCSVIGLQSVGRLPAREDVLTGDGRCRRSCSRAQAEMEGRALVDGAMRPYRAAVLAHGSHHGGEADPVAGELDLAVKPVKR